MGGTSAILEEMMVVKVVGVRGVAPQKLFVREVYVLASRYHFSGAGTSCFSVPACQRLLVEIYEKVRTYL